MTETPNPGPGRRHGKLLSCQERSFSRFLYTALTMTGLYERLLTQLFKKKIESDLTLTYYYGERRLTPDEAARVLSSYVAQLLETVLSKRLSDNANIEAAIAFVNTLVLQIAQTEVNPQDNLLDTKGRLLTAILERTQSEEAMQHEITRLMPTTGLLQGRLFSGASEDPTMASELAREIVSADRIDWLVSFVRESGIATLMPSLEEATARGAKFRLLTTTYMAVSDFSAIKRLASLPNTEVRISYNETTTRLHAKAYLFYRASQSHTVYVGSSNLSGPALTQGMEWNIKTTALESPHAVDAMFRQFEAYWHDTDLFEPYQVGDDERLQRALSRPYRPLELSEDELNTLESTDGLPMAPYTLFDYQEEVLTRLAESREALHSRRNLVVAATGTGKTVIAANDFKRYREAHPDATLLFVVHREEIIRQALGTFRRVLGDESFGEMWFSGVRPREFRHVFASVATLRNQIQLGIFRPDAFDFIIVDEAHHVMAPEYQQVLSHFTPDVLVGLTATPERLDKKDVKGYFDGRFSAEIRLADAINRGMLVPFTYYGVPDVLDLKDVKWAQGQYVASALSELFVNSTERSRYILEVVAEKIPDFAQIQALAFCVDQAHARAMGEAFTNAGYRVGVLTSDNRQERTDLLERLKRKDINCLFVVDMFNEGVDIPGIDTVLFLRPTQSLTIFLQQLGRGLRRAKDKTRLRVLDFIARTRAEFNWAVRFGALLGFSNNASPMSVYDALKKGTFPTLPEGCQIALAPFAQEVVLENIKNHIEQLQKTSKLKNVFVNWTDTYKRTPRLADFLRDTGITLEQLYRWGTWTQLKAIQNKAKPADTKALQTMVYKRWLLGGDRDYLAFLMRLVDAQFSLKVKNLSPTEQTYLMMFYWDYYNRTKAVESLEDMLNAMRDDRAFGEELKELLPLLYDTVEGVSPPEPSPLSDRIPLKLHHYYSRRQIMVACRRWTLTENPDLQGGVSSSKGNGDYRGLPPIDLLFVDINKDGKTESTAYEDYAIDRTTFHWQSPNNTTENSNRGQKLLDTTRVKLLFVRYQRMHDSQRRNAYVYLGAVKPLSHRGERPISFVFQLDAPMPDEVLSYSQR